MWSFLATLLPSLMFTFFILNFSRVLEKRRTVLSNPSLRSTEWASVSSCLVLMKWVFICRMEAANPLMTSALLASLCFLASAQNCSAFLKSSVSLILLWWRILFFSSVSFSLTLTLMLGWVPAFEAIRVRLLQFLVMFSDFAFWRWFRECGILCGLSCGRRAESGSWTASTLNYNWAQYLLCL